MHNNVKTRAMSFVEITILVLTKNLYSSLFFTNNCFSTSTRPSFCLVTVVRHLGSISSTCLRAAFMLADPKSVKSCLSWLYFCAFGICMRKSCVQTRGWNWPFDAFKADRKDAIQILAHEMHDRTLLMVFTELRHHIYRVVSPRCVQYILKEFQLVSATKISNLKLH